HDVSRRPHAPRCTRQDEVSQDNRPTIAAHDIARVAILSRSPEKLVYPYSYLFTRFVFGLVSLRSRSRTTLRFRSQKRHAGKGLTMHAATRSRNLRIRSHVDERRIASS